MSSSALEFLRGRGDFAPSAPPGKRAARLAVWMVAGGALYGAVMGSLTGVQPGHHLQLVVSGLKVPLMLLADFLLCLPSFFVLHRIAGLGDDFPRALRAVSGTLAAASLVLAALAPVTAFLYLSLTDYGVAVTMNGVAFLVASLGAVPVVRRYYGPLVAADRRHRPMIVWWFSLFLFTGIQLAWVLRPFIGDPDRPVAFLRANAWGNAYVVVIQLIGHSLSRI